MIAVTRDRDARRAVGVPLRCAGQTGCGPDAAQLEHLPMAGRTGLPSSAAVRAGPLFRSGQMGTDATLGLAGEGIGRETRQAMEYIHAILDRAGGSMDRIVKCTVMRAEMSEWGAMNQENARFFPGKPPARSVAGTSALTLGARVEIEGIALMEEP